PARTSSAAPRARRDRAHRVMDAAAAEPRLRDHESLAFAAEKVLARDADGVVAQVRMVPVAEWLGTEAREPDDLEPWRLARDEEHRCALMDRDVGVGDHHGDQELGEVGMRGE